MSTTNTEAACEPTKPRKSGVPASTVTAPVEAGVPYLHYYLQGGDWTGGNLGMAVRHGFDFCRRGVPTWHHLDKTCRAL